MAPLKCCVGDCYSTSDSYHLFSVPKDDDLRNLWMSFLVPTNPLLIGLSKEQLLRKRVCQKHFERHQLNGVGRRTLFSYPCLFSAKEMAHGTPLSSEEYDVLAEHNYCRQYEENNEDAETETLLVIGRSDYKPFDEHSYPTQSTGQINLNLDAPVAEIQASTSTQEIPFKTPSEHNKKASPICEPKPKKGSSVTRNLSSNQQRYRKVKKMVKKNAAESVGKLGIQRLNEAQNFSRNTEFFSNFDLLGTQAKSFLNMQLKLVRKNKMARRFSMEEKLIALTLMKQSPKGYRLLEKMFILPTKRTLNRMSQKIAFEPGIDHRVLKYIQETTKNWEKKKKLCTITFDEVALSPHLTFNESKEVIDGFVELAGERKQKYCDHALVFMIRGICSPWRQSLAYYFCESTVSGTELVAILKDIVSHIVQTGLIPLGLVCDQGSTFRTALKRIRQDTIHLRNIQGIQDDGTIEIAGLNLNIFYDPPHLLKSVRNNFLTKDIIFDGKTGSWKDIMFIFDIDSKLGHTRALPKLTAHHVVPEKVKKMKVSAATQVLSARTAAMLKYTDAINIHNSKGSSSNTTMATTAEIVEFFDDLFDSVNGSPGCATRGKLRSAVKDKSPHVEFWQQAIRKLKNLRFKDTTSKHAVRAGKPRIMRVPCLDGWITTLESFIRMTKLLLTEYGVEYYYPRYVNQDPLENFFGRIRAINYRNVNPDAHTFIFSFKALVLSNVLSPHSRFSNCEADDGETIINLNFLFESEDSNKENLPPSTSAYHISPLPSSSSQDTDENLITQVLMEKIRVHCSAYTAGYICRKISNHIKCNACANSYTTTVVDSIHKFIQYREYKRLKRNNLVYPNERFLRLYRDATECIHNFLNVQCHKKNICKNIGDIIYQNLQFSWLGCIKHHQIVLNKFLTVVIRMQVHNWCKIINKIFKGDIEKKYVLKMQEPQKMAYNKYEKIKLRKKNVNKIKNLIL